MYEDVQPTCFSLTSQSRTCIGGCHVPETRCNAIVVAPVLEHVSFLRFLSLSPPSLFSLASQLCRALWSSPWCVFHPTQLPPFSILSLSLGECLGYQYFEHSSHLKAESTYCFPSDAAPRGLYSSRNLYPVFPNPRSNRWPRLYHLFSSSPSQNVSVLFSILLV